jgi:hypothetical protein
MLTVNNNHSMLHSLAALPTNSSIRARLVPMQPKKSASGLCSGHATQNFWPAVHFTCIRGSKAAAIINVPRLMFQHSCNHSNYNSSSSSTTITTSSNYRAVGVMKTTNYNRFKLLMQRINEHNK